MISFPGMRYAQKKTHTDKRAVANPRSTLAPWGTFLTRGRCVYDKQEENMSRIKLLPMVLIVAFGLVAFYFTRTAVFAQPKNDMAPSFTLKLLSGGDIKSSELKGKVIVLKFVASY
jgi:hypothetical protein